MNNSVLIISSQDDMSTDEVLSWFSYYDIPFLRISDQDILTINCLDINNGIVDVTVNNTTRVDLGQFSKIWYRRGHFNFLDKHLDKLVFKNLLQKELEKVCELMEYYIVNATHINKPSDNNINKLIVLSIAKQIGIQIPNTKIVRGVPLESDLITKSISELGSQFQLADTTVYYGKGSYKLIESDMDKADFFPSLFQNYISKKYEIRSFYLKGEFSSMAIFSQQNEQTKFDYRRYDYKRPNRCVPYKLTSEYEKKLTELMETLNINCGSIDIIVDENEQYYFLEVNPIGQFQWLSKNCNYFIEKKIATYFKKRQTNG